MPTPSLLIVPARFKSGKLYSQIPTSGAGDFTVTRATSATRVNASGLIEVQKTNLALQSAGFQVSGTWVPENVTITTGTTSAFTAPDGSTDADLLTDNTTLGKHRVSQGSLSFTSGITYAFSVFVKKNSSGRFLLVNANTAFGARAALNLDTLEITNINGSGASVEDYGNGWYRFLVMGTTTSTQTTSVLIQMQDAATDANYIGNGSSFYLWGAQLEVGSSASEYIPTTTVARTRFAGVTVDGTVATNIPRLDYFASGGTVGCPALLVEPSGSNLAFNSQTWNASNNWQLSEGSGRVTVATATSGTLAPDGLSTANAISPTSGNIQHYLYSNATGTISYVSGTVYTLSAFFKKGAGDSGRYVQMASRGGVSGFVGNPYANFDLELGTTLIVSGSVADSNRVSRIQNYGNGWYRCSLTATCSVSSNSTVGVLAALLTADTNARLGAAFAGNTSDYIFGWGAQLETGSVATSYIPTTTGSVTRNADVVAVSGAVSGSIGQTSGTIYAEVDVRLLSTVRSFLSLTLNSNSTDFINFQINTSNQFFTRIRNKTGSVVDVVASGVTTTAGIHKLACSYSSGDITFALDGVIIGTNTNANTDFTAALNCVLLGAGPGATSGGIQSGFLNDRIRAAALYTTRLTNAQLAALTTP